MRRRRRIAITIFHWIEQFFFDPRRLASAFRGLYMYWSDWRRYAAMPGAERLSLLESYPQLHDRVGLTPVDAHYFYANGWAMRRILAESPQRHVDIASQTMFANLLAASVPVTFVDYRPLALAIDGVRSLGASILALPFANGGVASLSSIHVVEHIGLGRYGDPLDPAGTKRAAAELARVLSPGGSLFFAIPGGRTRVCFNAHRVHDPRTIREYFSTLDLIEFSAVHDSGRYEEHADMSSLATAEYACWLFLFRKPR